MARGEYVLVLQAEDRFLGPESLMLASPYLADKADLVSFSVLIVGSDWQRQKRSSGFSARTAIHMTMPHQGLCARRAMFGTAGAFDPSFRIAMDYDWIMRARACKARAVAVNMILAVMPANGVSSQTDWNGLQRRLIEFRQLHYKHARSEIGRLVYRCYWAFYMRYKKSNCVVRSR